MHVSLHRLAAAGAIPNSRLPVILLRGAIDAADPDLALTFERLFASHGWPPAWRNGIYPFPHFHGTCHEALGIARGGARVRLGDQLDLDITAGDAVVLPAGTGHQLVSSSPDLLVVGAYPRDSRYGLRRGRSDERAAAQAEIDAVPIPATDPVLGPAGGVALAWR